MHSAREGGCEFVTQDNNWHSVGGAWDLVIAHPPCTYLTCSGNRWLVEDKWHSKALARYIDRVDAIKFFMEFVTCGATRIAIENPIGIMSNVYRKPDQIIQPWQFGDNEVKSTCLWLTNLEPLVPSVTEKPEIEYFEWVSKDGKKKRQSQWHMDCLKASTDEERQALRSKTFQGIANAMAEQWG